MFFGDRGEASRQVRGALYRALYRAPYPMRFDLKTQISVLFRLGVSSWALNVATTTYTRYSKAALLCASSTAFRRASSSEVRDSCFARAGALQERSASSAARPTPWCTGAPLVESVWLRALVVDALARLMVSEDDLEELEKVLLVHAATDHIGFVLAGRAEGAADCPNRRDAQRKERYLRTDRESS